MNLDALDRPPPVTGKTEFDRLREWPGLRDLFDMTWRLFRVNLALVSPDGGTVVCYDSTRREAPFCRALRQLDAAQRLCDECDRNFFQQTLVDPKPLRYHCHAGLTEFIVPVIRQGQVIALMQCGQVLDAKPPSPGAQPNAAPNPLEPFRYRNPVLPPQRQADLMLFLEVLADYLAQTETPWLRAAASRPQQMVGRVMTHIEAHLAEPLTIESIARAVAVSSRTLSRLFAKETGMTVLGFLLRRRIALACHYLANSDLTCAEVAFAAGFQSIQNFNRTFRQFKATTPTAYRVVHANREAQSQTEDASRHASLEPGTIDQ